MASHVVGPFLIASEPLDDYERDLLDATVTWTFMTLFTNGSFSGMLAVDPVQSADVVVDPVQSASLIITGVP